MDEKVFLNNQGVSVSNSRFIVDGQTYAMNNVTSVKTDVSQPSRAANILFIVLGVLVLLGGGGGASIVVGLLMVVASVYFWTKNKPKHLVVLNTSSGETQALESQDEAFIERVVSALNESIVSRG